MASEATSAKGGVPEPAGFKAARYLVLAALLVLIGIPLAAMILRGARPQLLAGIATPGVMEATANTLFTSGLGALLATVVGAVLAWTIERTDIPARNLFRAAFFAPFLIPPFIGTIGWLAVVGPVGYVNVLYRKATGSGGDLVNLFGPGGIIVLLAIFSYPIVYLVVAAALRRVPAALEEAARAGGAGRFRVVWDVTLPLILPAMLAGFILTLVSNLSDFGVPALLGIPVQYNVLPTLIYSYLVNGTTENPLGAASALGILLLALAALAFALQRRVSKRINVDMAPGLPPDPVALGGARYPVVAMLAVVAFMFSVAPLLALLVSALLRAPGVPLTLENLTLSNIQQALTTPQTIRGAINSVILAAGAALISGLIGSFVATVTTRTKSRLNATLDNLSLAPQALPGTVVAVAWILTGIPLGIYNTRLIILFAYITAFVALVVQATRGPLASIPQALEESARLSGASPLRALRDITLPIAGPAILAGAALVFFTAIRELTISALLVSPGTETLGVVIFNLQEAGAYNSAQALALVVAVVGLVGAGAAVLFGRARGMYGAN